MVQAGRLVPVLKKTVCLAEQVIFKFNHDENRHLLVFLTTLSFFTDEVKRKNIFIIIMIKSWHVNCINHLAGHRPLSEHYVRIELWVFFLVLPTS
nr:Uncharacterised protein [Salmonella sp. NCTC 7297]